MGRLKESSWAGSAIVIALYCAGTSQPAMAQSTDPTPPGDLFSLSQIGQAAGQALKNDGIYLNGFYANDILGDVKGGNETGVTSTGDLHVGADFDMNTIAGIPGAAIHVMFDDRTGNDVSSLAGTQFGLSGQNGPTDTVRLSEFSWDQSLLDDHVRLLVGRINPTLDFDTSDIACEYVSNITCGQPFAWYVNNSGVSFPVSTWGGRVTFKPTLPTYLRVGVYQDDPTFNGVLEHGFDWGINTSTGVFIPFEIGDQTNFSTARYPFQYDIGGYDEHRQLHPACRLRRRGFEPARAQRNLRLCAADYLAARSVDQSQPDRVRRRASSDWRRTDLSPFDLRRRVPARTVCEPPE